MFSENKKGTMTDVSGQPNRIGQKTKIKGDIISEGDFRIDGELNGSVKTSGKVVIGKEGSITGKVECVNADIEGKFSGELFVSNVLSLKATANIEGDVVVAKLAIEPGATFNATCNMRSGGTAAKVLKNGQDRKTEKAS
ncbi:bactofilin family protein [Ascidiimonas sp. W6]|uniref:bactofilin family protein n=1 Tax=Ascidiimonas meishanensis TaxID=3128903 RepID=UPI0030EBF5B2